ncbi:MULTISPECIES: hypothetical protein [unclassified Pseudomonas]|uniref:hypothetical protein n=1 Tax=unclassified Pseudomonas TaxID=196821 RepID=UPI0009E983F1|nr:MULTISPECIES: hypothetical protein [unclassified Pseudomonas]
MGRRPKKPCAVTRLRERTKPSGKIYYYYDAGGKPRKEVPLGSDYGLAIMKYAELERDRNADNLAEKVVTLRYVSVQYFLDVVPKNDAQYLVKLLEFFDDPPGPLDSIEPQHAYQYMRWRSDASVSANREKALLSHMWNYARKMGYTKLANPCSGISGNPEAGSDKSESTGGILKVRDQLGHTTVTMTERYIRDRKGKKVTPTK